MVSKAIQKDALDVLLAALMPENENACRVSLLTGLRIGDVLNIRTEQIKQRRFTVIESKTNKKKRVSLPLWLCESILQYAGKVYAFPHRLKVMEPRTRQAVFKDIRRVSTALRLGKGASPHSMRKNFAVEKFHACGDLKKVQQLLNHSGEAVTALYCMADVLDFKRRKGAGAPNTSAQPGPTGEGKTEERTPAPIGKAETEQMTDQKATPPPAAPAEDKRGCAENASGGQSGTDIAESSVADDCMSDDRYMSDEDFRAWQAKTRAGHEAFLRDYKD